MLDDRKSALWDALGIGPQWVLRSKEGLNEARPEQPQTSQAKIVKTEEKQQTVHTREEQLIVRQATENLRKISEVTSSLNNRQVSSEAFGKTREYTILNSSWEELGTLVKNCKVCSIAHQRLNTVFGEGNPPCKIMLIGEAPGADEDKMGMPFVGRSGKLLDSILNACHLQRGKDVVIVNTLKCRPPMNRTPEASETLACRPFLERQIQLVDPEIIVSMGKPATEWLFGSAESLAKFRGVIHEKEISGKQRKIIVTYHPSYLLRSPVEKRRAWSDWCLLLDCLQP